MEGSSTTESKVVPLSIVAILQHYRFGMVHNGRWKDSRKRSKLYNENDFLQFTSQLLVEATNKHVQQLKSIQFINSHKLISTKHLHCPWIFLSSLWCNRTAARHLKGRAKCFLWWKLHWEVVVSSSVACEIERKARGKSDNLFWFDYNHCFQFRRSCWKKIHNTCGWFSQSSLVHKRHWNHWTLHTRLLVLTHTDFVFILTSHFFKRVL